MEQQKVDFSKKGEPALKQIRKALGYSQEALARKIGVSVRTLNRWERGVYTPTFTIPQIKNLEQELEGLGLRFRDLPDDLGPLPSSH